MTRLERLNYFLETGKGMMYFCLAFAFFALPFIINEQLTYHYSTK